MVLKSRVREHDFTVVENAPAASGLMRLVIKAPALAASLEPGQFMNFLVPGAKQILRVPLSFAHADAQAGTVEVVYATVGDATRALAKMAPGEESRVLGPSGNGWRVEGGQGRSIVIGGGVGAPPAVAAARLLAANGVAFDAVLGAQTADKLWGEKDLVNLGAGQVLVTTDDGTAGIKGFTTTALSQLLGQGEYDTVYTCGPQVMMAGIARICAEAGVKCQVSMERMMSCAFGACNTCNVSMADGTYKSCCMYGPVFDAKEVAW